MSGGRFALLVGSSRFTDPELVPLTSPAEDVEALREVLADPAIGGFQVETSLNRPAHEVMRAVEVFYADRKRDDMLLFYFSGHGLKDERGRLFFAMTDTEHRYLGATALAGAFLHDAMERARSRCDVLILDCCYSGAFANSRTAKGDSAIHTPERFRSRGRAVLTASDAMEFRSRATRPTGAARCPCSPSSSSRD
ncbi:caspase family protein [Amycolatopsis sp. H6(2020)]|nr:caspase family protein [Amycolatopsis sp. H6(2020)]